MEKIKLEGRYVLEYPYGLENIWCRFGIYEFDFLEDALAYMMKVPGFGSLRIRDTVTDDILPKELCERIRD